MSNIEPQVVPLEDCASDEVWPQATSKREAYLACIFHGTHKVQIHEVPVVKSFHGIKARVGSSYEPVSWICNPGCGAVFVAYLRGSGPECHCLDTPGMDAT